VGQGTGLGLSLGLGIATAHGGSLELCPPPSGRGACFKLTLPAQRPPEGAQDGLAAATPRKRERRQALVIEDEPPIRALLARLLARRDYAVTEAGSYETAKAASEGKTFDLVLCDVRLEDGSGAECLRHLMSRQPAIGRRFIFVTGDASALSDAQREFAGIPVLTKPFTASDFERMLGDVEVGV
jgi:CheY-like chemotaxis protein